MGKRGPPPKPSALKKLQGTFRADRTVHHEARPEVGAPEMPKHLSKDRLARERWEFLAPKLVELGLLTVVDGGVLEGYCRSYSMAVEADKSVQKLGQVMETPWGPKLNPAVRISRDSWAQVNVLGAKLGLSPSDRTRIDVAEKPKKDPVADDLFGIKGVVQGGKA